MVINAEAQSRRVRRGGWPSQKPLHTLRLIYPAIDSRFVQTSSRWRPGKVGTLCQDRLMALKMSRNASLEKVSYRSDML